MGKITIDYSEINSAAKKLVLFLDILKTSKRNLKKKSLKSLVDYLARIARVISEMLRVLYPLRLKSLERRKSTILIWPQVSKNLRKTLSMKRKVLLLMLDTLQPRLLN